ncbi:MAG TPA: hypothetical protein VKA06_10315, partial [Spirochaetia bacterium]|nr:hypothetical protein [Spirochaetia bacterium]
MRRHGHHRLPARSPSIRVLSTRPLFIRPLSTRPLSAPISRLALRLVLALTLLLTLGLFCTPGLGAQVQITRTLPETGGKTGTAQWGAPLPQTESARDAGAAELSGRLSLGSQAGAQPDGTTFTTVTTDSRLALVQPLGSDAGLTLNAAALRRRSANDENEDYSGDLSLKTDRIGFEVGGGYAARVRPVDEVERAESDASLRAAVSLAYLETLPMRLSYESTWTDREDDAVTTRDSQNDEAQFTAAGTAGSVGLELGTSLSRDDDRLEERETLGVGADLLVALPLGERLVVETGVTPNYNRSETPAATVTTRSVEYGGGPVWSFRDDLHAALNVSRLDAWTEAANVAPEDEHQVTWKGGGRLGYSPEEGLFGEARYRVAKTVEGNSTHDVSLPGGFRGGGGVVGEVT